MEHASEVDKIMFGKILFLVSEFGGLPDGMKRSLIRMNVDYLESPIWNMEESYELFKPQVVICFHHFLKNFDPYAERLTKLQCHKILWSWEEPWEIDYILKYHHFFTKVFTQDKNSANFINARTNNKAVFVPHAADPESCQPAEVPFEYRSDIFFCGAAYPSRLEFFRQVLPALKDYRIIIGGTGWEFLPDIQGQKIINTGISEGDYIKYVNGAKVNINLHRKSREMPIANENNVEASSPNNRFFEINMCGGFQLVDSERVPEIYEYYEKSQVFTSPSDFLHLLHKWIDGNPEDMKTMGKDARKVMLEKHTYEKRFTQIISQVI